MENENLTFCDRAEKLLTALENEALTARVKEFYTELFRKCSTLDGDEKDLLFNLPLPHFKLLLKELLLPNPPLDELIGYYIEKSGLLKLCREAVAKVTHRLDEIHSEATSFLHISCLLEPTLPSLDEIMNTYGEHPRLLRFYCAGVNAYLQEAKAMDVWRNAFEKDRNLMQSISTEKPALELLYLRSLANRIHPQHLQRV